jgi:hypothetical protein
MTTPAHLLLNQLFFFGELNMSRDNPDFLHAALDTTVRSPPAGTA